MEFWIKLSNEFVVSATLAAAEAYCYGDSKHTSAVETLGYVWGHRKRLPNRTIFYLDFLSISIAAKRAIDSVIPHSKAIQLKSNLMETLSPHKYLLGDLHTHPYADQDEVNQAKMGYYFSDDDIAAMLADDLAWDKSDNTPIMLIVTVCKMDRVHFTNGIAVSDNIYMFNVGEFRFWITASVGYVKNGKRQLTKSVQGRRKDFRTYLDLNPIYWNEIGQRELPARL